MKYWVSVLTIAVALLGIAYYNLYSSEMIFNDNSAGVLISSLGVIVTVLVGWQVFNAIENVKTLTKMENLENELCEKSRQIITLNSQVLDIIEAHHERELAQGIKYWECKYEHACKSLKLFLRGNVKADYEVLIFLLRDMASIIERVDNMATEDEKIVFARTFPKFDKEYNEAIEIIHSREVKLTMLRDKLTSLRDRRKKLFDDYAKMETSAEKEERKKTKT